MSTVPPTPPAPQPKPEGAQTVFVLGLLSILCCQILGPIAWIQGNSYREKCREMGVEPDGLAVGGRIMGIIGTVLLVLGVILGILYVAFVVFLVSSGAMEGAAPPAGPGGM